MQQAKTALCDHAQELAALSLLLRDYPRFVALGLHEQHFTALPHLAVVRAAQTVAERAERVTVEAVQLEMQRSRTELAKGLPGLVELRRGPVGVVLDAPRLKLLASLRSVHDTLLEGARLAGEEDLSGALAKLDGAMSLAKTSATILDLGQLVDRAMQYGLEEFQTKGRRLVYSGSEALEEAIGGFRAGGMYVLGALSNVGKSYVVQSWMLRAAKRGVGVGWLSLEDPESTTGSRALGILSAVEPRTIEDGKAYGNSAEASRLEHGASEARALSQRFLYADLTGQTELDVCAAMSAMAARGARIIVVDYVGVITASKEQQDRRNEIRWVAIRLKAHAKRLGVALLLISQLTMPRDEGGVAKEPSKYSLRESGDLTNAAEVIIVAWREDESGQAPVNIKIAKSKSGGEGLRWTMERNPETQEMVETSRPAYKQKPRAVIGGFR